MIQTNRLDLTVIIPVHKINGEHEENMLYSALMSIAKQDLAGAGVLIVMKNDNNLKKTVHKIVGKLTTDQISDIGNIEYLTNKGEDAGFQAQLNLGVNHIPTTWFSYLQFDDVYSNIWFRNVSDYITHNPEYEMFLPLIVDFDVKDNFVGFTNEATWAHGFTETSGVLTNDSLMDYQNFSFDGMVMKKESYIKYKGLKTNFVLTFMYEFLLRMTYNTVKAMIIPKIGYKHVNQREGSLFETYTKTLTPDESNWWLDKAKKEYLILDDRKLSYR